MRRWISSFGKVCPELEKDLAGQLVLVRDDRLEGQLVLLEEIEHLVHVTASGKRSEEVQTRVLPKSLKKMLLPQFNLGIKHQHETTRHSYEQIYGGGGSSAL